MKIIGLTGGIGSGKTTVANMFKDLGISVYIADEEAKRLTDRSKIIRRRLTSLLGSSAYRSDGSLDREYVANRIFSDTDLLKQVNHIIHPKVASHFNRWVQKQEGPYCIKEAAILFETGGYRDCDFTILVTAPKSVKIERLKKRDNSDERSIEMRMSNQWSDDEKLKLADFIIDNQDLERTKKQVLAIHEQLKKTI